MLEPQTLKFLSGIRDNNNKPWFDAHRAQYEASRIDFQNFIHLVLTDLQRFDTTLSGVTTRDCLFRINRDVRFSNDKSPYKANMGASIKRGGKKSGLAGYYFHLEPGKSFIGGGLWIPNAEVLKKVRQEIDYNWQEFSGLVKNKNFRKVYTDLYKGKDVSLVTSPKGYDKDNPVLPYLKLKSFIAQASVTDEELTKASLHKTTVTNFKALQSILHFINRALVE